ncbi:hypothetical protein Bbelb_188170 [Branchiostoma belcheri]|nr:hypothetical protein Bbelb_188170 [Branchiostoma belcheri]
MAKREYLVKNRGNDDGGQCGIDVLTVLVIRNEPRCSATGHPSVRGVTLVDETDNTLYTPKVNGRDHFRAQRACINNFQELAQVPAQRQSVTGRSLRNSHNITVPHARTKRLQQSFLHYTIRLYNNLP